MMLQGGVMILQQRPFGRQVDAGVTPRQLCLACMRTRKVCFHHRFKQHACMAATGAAAALAAAPASH